MTNSLFRTRIVTTTSFEHHGLISISNSDQLRLREAVVNQLRKIADAIEQKGYSEELAHAYAEMVPLSSLGETLLVQTVARRDMREDWPEGEEG